MRRGRRKALYRTEKNSLKGLHEEAEIQHKALRRGRSLAFNKNASLEKERMRSKAIPRKVGMGLKRREESIKKVRLEVILVGIH